LNVSSSRLVIIPGNHDINWKLCAAARLQSEALRKPFSPPYLPKYEIFDQFYTEIYHDNRSFVENPFFTNHVMADLGLAVTGFSSTTQETEVEHYGWVGVENVKRAGEELNEIDPDQSLTRIAAIHHNYFRASNLDEENLRDADEIRQALIRYGYSLVLHGHRHIAGMRIDKDPSTNRELLVLSTGSAGLDGNALPDHPNQYQVIDFGHPDSAICYLRRFSSQSVSVSGIGQWLPDSTQNSSDGIVSFPFKPPHPIDASRASISPLTKASIVAETDRSAYTIEMTEARLHFRIVPPQPTQFEERALQLFPVHHVLVLDVSSSMNQDQCRPIGNMHKTIDFIGDLKSDGCFKWHTPSHGVQKCQKAFIFGGFHAFSMGRL
jgi:hypothetical protein